MIGAIHLNILAGVYAYASRGKASRSLTAGKLSLGERGGVALCAVCAAKWVYVYAVDLIKKPPEVDVQRFFWGSVWRA